MTSEISEAVLTVLAVKYYYFTKSYIIANRSVFQT